MRPRVLFVACHLPWPALSGGRRRELELIRRLAPRFDIHLIAISKTPAQDRGNVEPLAALCHRVEILDAAPAGEAWLDRDDPPQVLRHRSAAARQRIAQLLTENPPDVIHVEGFYLMQHIPSWSPAPVLLVEQNVEYELERQRALRTGDELSLRRFARTRAAERECWTRATQLAAVTEEDRRGMEEAAPGLRVRVVPDGADHVPLRDPDGSTPRGNAIAFIANFAYAPNVDAARHLAQELMPSIRAEVPDVRVWLVGNAPPLEVRSLADAATTVTGFVPDVLPYLDRAAVIVCPLRIGGGIKVKTIEALRRGKAIVSTSVGAQGLDGPARAALCIADDPREFAAEVIRLLRDASSRAQLERRAAAAARGLITWDEAAARLAATYRGLLQGMDRSRQLDLPAAGGRG